MTTEAGATDTICECGHWYEEHEDGGACFDPGCVGQPSEDSYAPCAGFTFSPELSTAEAIADRGGDHSQADPPCQCAMCVDARAV